MDERLHNILDGNVPEKGSEGLFDLPENRQALNEHRKLQEALRHNADAAPLSSAEKSAMGGALASAIGLEAAGGSTATTQAVESGGSAGTNAPVVAGSSWWSLKGVGMFLLAMALGAGIFAVADNDEPVQITKTVGIPIESAVPSAVPFGLPGAGSSGCEAMIQQLQDSIRTLQNRQKSIRSRSTPRRPSYPPPTTGD